MPYKDPEKQKEYQKKWVADKRARETAKKLSEGEKAVLVAMYESIIENSREEEEEISNRAPCR